MDHITSIEKMHQVHEEGKPLAKAHYNTAFIGGFIGAYPCLCVAKQLSSALTATMVGIFTHLVNADFMDVLLRIVSVLLYAGAIALATYIPKHTKYNIRYLAMFIDLAAAVILFLLPEDTYPVISLYPTFFAVAFQWHAFPGAYGYVASTIFSTNNTKQLASSLTEVYLNHEPTYKLKAHFYANVLIIFHIGVLVDCIIFKFIGRPSIIFVVFPILTNFVHLRKAGEFLHKE